jgi:hypothetical protein
VSQTEGQEQLPSLTPFLDATALYQKMWLMLVQSCHKPDCQETITCLLTTAEDIMNQSNVSTKLVEDTKAMLSQLMEYCYDTNLEKTVENMQSGFEQINSGLPSAYEERYGQRA